MATSPERLSLLFRRYYAGIATPGETNELLDLIRFSKSDESLADALRLAWDHLNADEKQFSEAESDSMLHAILYETEQDLPAPATYQLRWWRYAAAAVLIAVSAFLFYQYKHRTVPLPQVAETPRLINDVAPGGNRALLTLADGASFVLDSARTGLLARIGSAEITKTSEGQLTVNTGNTRSNADFQSNTLSTPKGGQYQLVLPDGSKVWLNASSSIKFPTLFTAAERKVEITGEVYFEVTKDNKRPFKVRFGNSEVEVLGTSFNIMAYPDEKTSKTTLVEGSVRLRSTGSSRMLVPGQQGSISSNGTIATAAVDTERETAWKQGLFYFRDSGIREIMRDASRWYDIEVVYKGNIPRRQFTGKVSRNVNISELLNMLRYAGVNSKIENNKVLISM